MRLALLFKGTLLCLCAVIPAQLQLGAATTDSATSTKPWSVAQARQYIIDKHVLRPTPTQVPDDHAALESWLLNLDPHAAIQPRSLPDKESLGLLSIRDGDETILVPLPAGAAWSSGLRSAIRLIDKAALAHNTIVGTQLDNGMHITQQLTPTRMRFGAVEIDTLGGLPTMSVTSFLAGKTVRSARFKLEEQKQGGLSQKSNAFFSDHWLLDLRYCAGGNVFEATDFGGLWLQDRVDWVSIKNVAQPLLTLKTGGRELLGSAPLAVVVSRYTASSCEQLVMGLKKYAQVLVLGEQTAGKCSVQTTTPLSGGFLLRISTGLWSGPDNELCNDSGLVPDLRFTGNMHNREEVSDWLPTVLEPGYSSAIREK